MVTSAASPQGRWRRMLLTVAACLLQAANVGVGASGAAGAGSQAAESGNCRAAPAAQLPELPKRGPVSSKLAADILSQEVEELESFVGLCRERIGLLKALARAAAQGKDMNLSQSRRELLRQKFPPLSQIASEYNKAPTASFDEFYVTKTVITSEVEIKAIEWLPLRNHISTGVATASQLALPSSLLVAAQADGTVRVYTPAGESALAFTSGHEHPIEHLAVSPSMDESLVATADAAGVVRVHKINAKHRRAPKSLPKMQRFKMQGEEKVSQFLGLQANVTAQFVKGMVTPKGNASSPPRLTALQIASYQGSKYFITGDDVGKLRIYGRNGSLQAQFDALPQPELRSPIENIHASLGSAVFAAGGSWGFIDLDRLVLRRLRCPRLNGYIRHAIADSQISSRFFVADAQGTVYVLKVEEKRDCKVEHRFPPGSTTWPLELQAVRGFLVGVVQVSSLYSFA
eukprot:TRINITY_DN31788_c0_g1_i2.p1 TRINITY_DN31788_c0_g1~~TRINITY_DN31788_c0_g1_i2.p1  ORF type:complete len:459 (+),score=118.79 TRINITY_DN31788_c0_g1_i2:130-1506(+)